MSESPKRSENAGEAPDPLDMSAEGDANLLAFMSMKGEYPEHARAAWAEFYRRHVRYVDFVCRKVLDGLARPPATPEEMTADTFLRAYEKAGTYCEPSGLDADTKRRNLRVWLTQISRRLICDRLRAVPADGPEQQLDDERWAEQTAAEACAEGTHRERLRVLEEVLQNDLDEREREVLRTTFQYYVYGRKTQRLPNKVAEELAQRLGTTAENVRKIRQRALDKVRAALERRLGPLPETA